MENDDDQNILVSNDADCVEGRGSKLRSYKLEPALILIFFGWNLAGNVIPNQLLRETCLSYGFNSTDCSRLGQNDTRDIEELIQPKVAEIMMAQSLITSIIPAVMSLFIGPWSDKFGRKGVICATFVGFSLSLASFWALSFMADRMPMVSPWLYLLPYIPVIAAGGWPTMIVAILCYVSDMTNEANRSSRLALIEMLIFVGIFFSSISSSYILSLTSTDTVFLISTVCSVVATVYTMIFVEESVRITETFTTCDKVKGLLSPAPLIEMLKTSFKRRPFKERRILWCLITILMFSVFTMNGTSTVFYLFVREKFQWTLRDYTLFDSANILIAIAGCVFGLVFLKKILGFSDISLAVLALLSQFVDALIKSTAERPMQMYASSLICAFKILVTPMARSLMTTVVDSNEIGKVFSIASSFEAVSSLVSSPLYTYIYNETFTFYAGAFFLISAAVYAINLVLIYCVIRMRSSRESLLNPYTQITS